MINKIIVINLKKRIDRKENIIQLFNSINLNYIFYEAIDGNTLNLTLEIKNLFNGNDFLNRKGFIGCALSHYNIWVDLLKEKNETVYYTIFEDDITISPYFSSNFKKIENHMKNNLSNIDILFLGYHTINSNYLNINEYAKDIFDIKTYNKNEYVGGFFSYIITKNGAKKMLDFIQQNGIKHGIDYIIKINPTLYISEIYPNIVFSKWVENNNTLVDSNIQKDIEIFDFHQLYDYHNYLFIPKMDIMNCDFERINTFNINHFIEESNKYDNVDGFNTLGFLKTKIDKNQLQLSSYFNENDGIFIKLNKMYRVKMICDQCSSKELCDQWNNMSKGNHIWNNIKITYDDNDIDYYVIINRVINNEYYDPMKTILFQMEPYCYNPLQNYGVKTWGKWANIQKNDFMDVRTHKYTYNNCESLLNETYYEISTMKINKTKNYISSICSEKYFDPGHIKRIDFLKYIEKNYSDFTIDIYGRCSKHNFKNYYGELSRKEKSKGLMPYKYYFMCENNSERNYITEKFWEALLCECFIFYYGAANVSEYINPRAYIQLNLNDFSKSYKIMKQAINDNLWEKNIDIIREEKYKILNYYNFFPTIERSITKDIWKNELQFLYNKIKIYILKQNQELNYKMTVFIKTLKEFNFDVEIVEYPDNVITNVENTNYKKAFILNKIKYIYSNNDIYDTLQLIELYENIMENSEYNYSSFLIISDNIIFDSSLNNLFNSMKYLPENYDYVQLYYDNDHNQNQFKIIDQKNSLYYTVKKYYFQCEYAHFVSKNGISKIINYIGNTINYSIKDYIYECYENMDFHFYVGKNKLFI